MLRKSARDVMCLPAARGADTAETAIGGPETHPANGGKEHRVYSCNIAHLFPHTHISRRIPTALLETRTALLPFVQDIPVHHFR
jgi:hypothetical protein